MSDESEDVMVHSMSIDEKGARLELSHSGVKKLATQMAKLLKDFDAPNHVTATMSDGEELFEMTVRRCSGKTPADKIAELEETITGLNKLIDDEFDKVESVICDKCVHKLLNADGYTDKDIEEFMDNTRKVIADAIAKKRGKDE